MRFRQLYVDLLLGILLPLSITFLLLHPLLIQKGVPFYGDETYYYVNPESFYFNPFNWFFSWVPANGLAPPPLTFFSHSVPLTSLTYLFGQEFAVKSFILIVAALPGILTYFASKILAREWSLFNDEKKITILAFVSGLFMLLAFTNPGLLGAGTAPAFSYVTLPLSFALFVRYIKKGSFKDLLFVGLISLFAIANPFWIYLMAIMGCLYVLLEFPRSSIRGRALIRRTLLFSSALLFIHAFWLLPTAASYTLGAGGFYQVYTQEKLITLEGLRFLSHWNLLDVIMVGEHSYYFFWLHPQNYGPLNVIIPMLAVIPILVFRKKRQVLFIALILTIGIFLTKGVHEPGGYLYYLIAKSLPYGAGAILRNPTKFVPLVSFSYAFLVGLSITSIYEKLRSLKILAKPIINSRLMRYGVTASLTLLVLTPLAYGTILDLQGYTWPRYKPVYVPSIYDDINNWLLQQQGNFKVMWIPSGGSYVWKPYIITRFPDLLSAKPSVPFTEVYPQPWKSTNVIGRLLAVLGVKYVIYHGDSIDYPNQEILQDIMSQKDLRIVYSSNFTYVPEDNSRKSFPIIVFQNEDYNEPIYVNDLALTYGSDKNALLNYINQLNTSTWAITSIENTSVQTNQFDYAKLFIYSNSSFPQWLKEYLANSNLTLAYILPINSLNLVKEQTFTGPFNPSYYVYNETPLAPIGSPTFERGKNVQATFHFQLPKPVLAEGYKGAFWAGFGIAVFGYPHGVAPPPQLTSQYRVFWTTINNFTLIDEYSGYVTFNITIPATFQGRSVDVYANFYDGGFRPISPMYFLGNFPIRGVSLVKSSSQPTELHIINDSLSLNIYIPRNQEYTLAVKFNGTLNINGTSVNNGDMEWRYVGPFQFERGNITLKLSTDKEAYVQDLILFSNDQKNQNLTEIFNTKTANIVDYKQISPVEWRATVNSSEPFILVFTEPYDSLWIAHVNGERIKPIPLYSMINGFKINQTGQIEITIEYQLQKWFTYGSTISALTFLACLAYLTRNYTKNVLKKLKQAALRSHKQSTRAAELPSKHQPTRRIKRASRLGQNP